MSWAVFLDRDGTIIRDRHFLSDPAGVELLRGAAEGLRRLRELGARLVVVSNQSGVGRGYFSVEDVERVNDRMRTLLRAEGAEVDAIYVCPHSPDEGCECRKPAPGLLLRAADELGLDLSRSFVVGDREADVEAARAAGATPLLISPAQRGDERCVEDLVAAAAVVAALSTSRPDPAG